MAVYVGHLYEDSGIWDILPEAKQLADVEFQLVGVHNEDMKRWSTRIKKLNLDNVRIFILILKDK
jgi:hypothetical protein